MHTVFYVRACYSNFPRGKQGQNVCFLEFSCVFVFFGLFRPKPPMTELKAEKLEANALALLGF